MPDPNPNLDFEPDPNMNFEPDPNPDFEPDLNPDFQYDPNPDLELDPNLDFDPNLELGPPFMDEEPLLQLDAVIYETFSKQERRYFRSKMDKLKTIIEQMDSRTRQMYWWLLSKNLIYKSRVCEKHERPARMHPVLMSSEMAWVCDVYPEESSHSISILTGSIFEESALRPAEMLWHMWYWARCTPPWQLPQTMSSDEGMAVDLRRHLRAVCTVALQRCPQRLGYGERVVQVAVANFEAEDGSGCMVLAALEPDRNLLRLRAFDWPQEARSVAGAQPRRTTRLTTEPLRALSRWLCPSALVAADVAVDDAQLRRQGFRVLPQDQMPDASTQQLMGLLTRDLPTAVEEAGAGTAEAMQPLLDEAAWRHSWGPLPYLAFTNMLNHIAFLTQAHATAPPGTLPWRGSFATWLRRVADAPLDDWSAAPGDEVQALGPFLQQPPAFIPIPLHEAPSEEYEEDLDMMAQQPPPPQQHWTTLEETRCTSTSPTASAFRSTASQTLPLVASPSASAPSSSPTSASSSPPSSPARSLLPQTGGLEAAPSSGAPLPYPQGLPCSPPSPAPACGLPAGYDFQPAGYDFQPIPWRLPVASPEPEPVRGSGRGRRGGRGCESGRGRGAGRRRGASRGRKNGKGRGAGRGRGRGRGRGGKNSNQELTPSSSLLMIAG